MQTPGRLHPRAHRRARSREIEAAAARRCRGVTQHAHDDRRHDRPAARRRGRRHRGLDLRPPRRPRRARLHAVRRHGRRAREILAEYPDLRTSVQGVNLLAERRARATPTSSSTCAGPDLDEARRSYADRLMRRHARDPGLRRRRHHALGPQARAAGRRSTARRPPTSASACRTSPRRCGRWSAASRSRSTRRTDEQYDVWLRADADRRRRRATSTTSRCRRRRGELVRLANLVRPAARTRGPAQIDRYNRQRKVTIVANL